MKDDSVKAVKYMVVLLLIIVFVIPIVCKIEHKQVPEWMWAILCLMFSMCLVLMALERIVFRIKCLEEKLQTKYAEKEK